MRYLDIFMIFAVIYVIINCIVFAYKKYNTKRMHRVKCNYLESVGFILNTNQKNPMYCKNDKFVSLAVIDRYTIAELRSKYK